MANRLAEAIGRLHSSSARLNQLTDEANTTVKEVEDFLNKECSAGIFASVIVSETDFGSESLEYRRVGQRYRIAIVWREFDNEMDPAVKPWSECSRDEKIETIERLPALIIEVAKRLDEKILDAEKAVVAVSQVLQNLPRKKEGSSTSSVTPQKPLPPTQPPPPSTTLRRVIRRKKED